MDTRQLVLIDSSSGDDSGTDWKLDEHTRQVGLEGVAAARRALRDALAHGSALVHADNEDTQSSAA